MNHRQFGGYRSCVRFDCQPNSGEQNPESLSSRLPNFTHIKPSSTASRESMSRTWRQSSSPMSTNATPPTSCQSIFTVRRILPRTCHSSSLSLDSPLTLFKVISRSHHARCENISLGSRCLPLIMLLPMLTIMGAFAGQKIYQARHRAAYHVR